MASSVFQGLLQNALSGLNFLPRTLADFQQSIRHSADSVEFFNERMANALPLPDKSAVSADGTDSGDNGWAEAWAGGEINGGTGDGADAAARTLLALADAGSGFEKQLQLLNPSVRAVALANEDFASQIKTLSVEAPASGALAALPALAQGGQLFTRLTAPLITRGSGYADDVPALLMRDEFVMRQAAVKKYGLPLLYALNNLEIPAERAERATAAPQAAAVAAYASGGVVSGNASLAPEAYYHSFSAPQDAAWSDSRAAAYAAELVAGVRESLGIGRMQSDPQGYLNDILSAFSNDSRSLKIFASGGSTGAAGGSSALQREKARVTQEYAAKIQTARDLGNVELTELYELQLNTLLQLIDDLLHTLQQLAQSYLDSVGEVLADYEEEFDAIQEDAGGQLAALRSQYQALGKGSTLISSLGGDAASEKKLQGQAKNNMRAVESSRTEAEDEAEALYLARTRRLLDTLQLESAYEANSAANAGGKEIIQTTADLQRAYLETLQDIRDLEAERDATLADLEDEYTSGTIAESAEYLRDGGLVGRLSALDRLLSGQGLSWAAGLPLPAVRAFAQGGLVSGGISGEDSVPALLTPGEYVLNTRAVQRIGLAALEAANARTKHAGELPRLPAFAQGGLVKNAGLAQPQQEHLVRFDLGAFQPTVRTDSDNLRSLVRGLKEVRKRMAR